MKITTITAFACLPVILFLQACNGRQEAPKSPSPTGVVVVTTIFPLADWVSQIGGDLVTTVTLLPPAASPHTYEPTPSDMRKVRDARLFIKAGLNLDDWAMKVSSSGARGARIFSIGDQLHEQGRLPDVEHLDEEAHDVGHEHGVANPHWFMDPRIAVIAVEQIAHEIGAIDPRNREQYLSNAQRYIAELEQLDAELSATLAGCATRGFATVHNSFSYLAARYGLKIAAVVEEFPGKVPSDQYIREVVDRLRAGQVTTVFAEPQIARRPAEIVATEAGARVGLLDPLGDPDSPDRNSYIKMMRYNAAQLKKAVCD